MRAYAGFQMATALVVGAKAHEIPCAWLVLSLFALSIPSSIAYLIVAHITEEDKERYSARISHVAGAMAYIPSVVAFALLLGVPAGIIFATISAAWFVV